MVHDDSRYDEAFKLWYAQNLRRIKQSRTRCAAAPRYSVLNLELSMHKKRDISFTLRKQGTYKHDIDVS